jgi:hypothetical protein
VFGRLIESGAREVLMYGYLLGGVLMIGGGVIQAALGINCQRCGLEDVAAPMSLADTVPARRSLGAAPRHEPARQAR